jgi:hypothetical protein
MQILKRLCDGIDRVRHALTAAGTTETSQGASGNRPSPQTRPSDPSHAEREEYWKSQRDIAPADQMRVWEQSMEPMLAPYTTDTPHRGELAFLRRLLQAHPAQSIDTVEVSAPAIYRLFFEVGRGDIAFFARRIVSTSTREEIQRNQHLIGQLALIYGTQSATRVLPLIAALQDAQGHHNGHRASTPELSTVIGTDMKTGRDVSLTQRAKVQGVYIIGENGTGKTNTIKTMVASDIQNGLGLCVIEPHGDMTSEILGLVPRERQNDIVYLDIEDWEKPFGLGLFEVPEPRNIRTEAATASFLSHTFEVLWNAGFETPRLMQNLRAVVRTLIANPGSTFADIPLLYSSEETRARMLANVGNPHVLAFWEEYEHMNFRDRRAFSESFLNKVTAFLDEPMISHILSQPKSTIDFRYIMDNAKILLIKLSPQFSEASSLIGATITGKLLLTAFSRTDVPPERRRPFNLYVDEFQRFQSSDFATFISESRKFSISTVLSHQVLTQLTEQVRASALGAGTIMCFRVSGQDSPVLARSYDTTPTKTIVGEEPVRAPVADVVSHLVRHGSVHPAVQTFVAQYLLPLTTLARWAGSQTYPFEFGCTHVHGTTVLSAQASLNETLARCMREGRFDLSLHPLALFVLGGAADIGIPFVFADYIRPRSGYDPLTHFSETAFIFGRPDALENRAVIDYLLKKHAKKRYWESLVKSRMVTPGPSFLRMLTVLREVMAILSKDPVLIDTGKYQPKYQMRLYSDMAGEVSNYLANQANYCAKVKIVNSGEYTIKTKPAPQGLTGDALTERIEAVKRHMLALGYTRHYTDVIEEMRKRTEYLLGLGDTQPPDHEEYDPDDEPPRGSFTLD